MDAEGDARFLVLVNDEAQYSLWPSTLAVPGGWRPEGFEGDEDDCVAYVDATWTDMRPLSLRRADGQEG